MFKIAIVSLFPESFESLRHSIIKKALDNDLIDLSFYNPRDFTQDKHQRVDDRPFGGGPGMVMMVQPLRDAIKSAKKALDGALCIYLSPKGKTINQPMLNDFASSQRPLILVCGHYEGIDQRVIDHDIDLCLSLGDFVLTGGELAAMCLIDGITRLLPQALGSADSALQDSFSQGFLDYSHYTRPQTIDQQGVPEVLLSGNHMLIEKWRAQNALLCTYQARPDLLNEVTLSREQQCWLNEYKNKN